jgi:hypothetical protein
MKTCSLSLDMKRKAVENYFEAELVSPWNEVLEMAEKQAEDGCTWLKENLIPEMQEHVHNIRHKHRIIMNITFTAKPIQERQDSLRRISLEFVHFVTHPPEGSKLLTYLTKDSALAAISSYGKFPSCCYFF